MYNGNTLLPFCKRNHIFRQEEAFLAFEIFSTFKSGSLLYNNSSEQSISNSKASSQLLSLLCFIEIPVFNANSVDSAASDLALLRLIVACRLNRINAVCKKASLVCRLERVAFAWFSTKSSKAVIHPGTNRNLRCRKSH